MDASWGDDLDRFPEVWPDLAVFWPEDDDLISWYLQTNDNLVRTLRSASPDIDAWAFLPAPSPLAMWARRQAHETAVHRFDGELAAGTPPAFDPTFAADGIDELVAGFAPRKNEFPVDRDRTVVVHAEDTGDRWHITLAPTGITTVRDGDRHGDLRIAGAASDLYLMLWNRIDASNVAVSGDSDVLDLWRNNVRIRWS